MGKLFKKALLLILTLFLVTTLAGYGYYQYLVHQIPLKTKITQIQNEEDYVEFEEISPYLLDATVSVEDQRFYEHKGVDIIALGRILYVLITTGRISGGGSTITQQLAKNLYFDFSPSLFRKFPEYFITKELENTYEKAEILEIYVNIINYGDNCMGISEASQHYFNKTPSELTFDEATLLAGIPQSPANYQLSNHEEAARVRQKAVIQTIIDNEIYPEKQLDSLLEELGFEW